MRRIYHEEDPILITVLDEIHREMRSIAIKDE
jgi:hypothetical protein